MTLEEILQIVVFETGVKIPHGGLVRYHNLEETWVMRTYGCLLKITDCAAITKDLEKRMRGTEEIRVEVRLPIEWKGHEIFNLLGRKKEWENDDRYRELKEIFERLKNGKTSH